MIVLLCSKLRIHVTNVIALKRPCPGDQHRMQATGGVSCASQPRSPWTTSNHEGWLVEVDGCSFFCDSS